MGCFHNFWVEVGLRVVLLPLKNYKISPIWSETLLREKQEKSNAAVWNFCIVSDFAVVKSTLITLFNNSIYSLDEEGDERNKNKITV